MVKRRTTDTKSNKQFTAIGDSFRAFGEALQRLFKRSKPQAHSEEVDRPTDIVSFLEQKKQREPFYKAAHKTKPWE